MFFNILEFLNFSFIFSVAIFSLMFWIRTKDNYIGLCLTMIMTILIFHSFIIGQNYFTTITLAYPGDYFSQSLFLKIEGLMGGFLELILVSIILLFSSHYFFTHLRMGLKKKKNAYAMNISLNIIFLTATSVYLVINMQGEGWKLLTRFVQYQIYPIASLFIGLNGLTAWILRGKVENKEIKNEMTMIARNFSVTIPLSLIDMIFLKESHIRLSFLALTPFFLHVFFHLSRYYYLNYETYPSEQELIPNMVKLGLTEREREIALLIIKGINYSDIGEELFISVNTVKTHSKNIYRKTGVSNRTQLNYMLRTPNPAG